MLVWLLHEEKYNSKAKMWRERKALHGTFPLRRIHRGTRFQHIHTFTEVNFCKLRMCHSLFYTFDLRLMELIALVVSVHSE